MPPSSGKAELFTERDYLGESRIAEEGMHPLGTSTGAVGIEVVSSLKVAPGYAVTVYSVKGASETFTADTAYVGGVFPGIISSVKVSGKSVRQRIFDSFHDAESKKVLPKGEVEAKEYSQSVYAVWKSISASLGRNALLIFLLMAIFELLAYQHTLTAISIGSFTLVNVPIIQIALPTVVAFLVYDGSRLTARFLRLELVYMELMQIYAPRLQENGLELLLEPNLPSLWGVGALTFEHTGNFSDSFMRKVNQTVIYILMYAVPIAFECQAYYRLVQKFGYHNIFLWINLIITLIFIVPAALFTWFDRLERAKWWKQLRPNQ